MNNTERFTIYCTLKQEESVRSTLGEIPGVEVDEIAQPVIRHIVEGESVQINRGVYLEGFCPSNRKLVLSGELIENNNVTEVSFWPQPNLSELRKFKQSQLSHNLSKKV